MHSKYKAMTVCHLLKRISSNIMQASKFGLINFHNIHLFISEPFVQNDCLKMYYTCLKQLRFKNTSLCVECIYAYKDNTRKKERTLKGKFTMTKGKYSVVLPQIRNWDKE